MGENVLHHDAACRGLRPHRAQRNEATAGARKTVASNTLSNNFGHLVLVRITHYPADPRQRCSFLRGTLGVAASYQYLAVGVLAVNAPDGRTGVVICGAVTVQVLRTTTSAWVEIKARSSPWARSCCSMAAP